MAIVAAAVVGVWAVLLGTAYLALIPLRLGRSASLLLLVGVYLVLATLAVAAIGASGRGLLGAAGMLVPLAVACMLVTLRRPSR